MYLIVCFHIKLNVAIILYYIRIYRSECIYHCPTKNVIINTSKIHSFAGFVTQQLYYYFVIVAQMFMVVQVFDLLIQYKFNLLSILPLLDRGRILHCFSHISCNKRKKCNFTIQSAAAYRSQGFIHKLPRISCVGTNWYGTKGVLSRHRLDTPLTVQNIILASRFQGGGVSIKLSW